jgi:LPXTG-site transpeptidase (sortase) family protein
VRLIIPLLNVDALIQQVGVTPDGEMATPSNTVDVGWFKHGTPPGKKGSAVISGHFNGADNTPGVFANLHKLKEGDLLYIENSDGNKVTFVVTAKQLFDPGYADHVFSSNTGTYLNLITCDGVFDETTNSYTKRLIVFTQIVQ